VDASAYSRNAAEPRTGAAVEFERALRQKALRLAVGVLCIDGLTITRAQLLDSEFFDPDFVHQHLLR